MGSPQILMALACWMGISHQLHPYHLMNPPAKDIVLQPLRRYCHRFLPSRPLRLGVGVNWQGSQNRACSRASLVEASFLGLPPPLLPLHHHYYRLLLLAPLRPLVVLLAVVWHLVLQHHLLGYRLVVLLVVVVVVVEVGQERVMVAEERALGLVLELELEPVLLL